MKQLRIALLALAALASLTFAIWALMFLTSPENSVGETPIAAKTVDITAVRPEEASSANASDLVEARGQIEAKLKATPEYWGFVQKLKQSFPHDYDQALQSVAARNVASGANAADLFLAEAVRQLRRSHGVMASRADTPALDRVLALQLETLRQLQRYNAQLCVDYLKGEGLGDFTVFASSNRPLMGDVALAGLDAILTGRARNLQYPPPTMADFDVFEKKLTEKSLPPGAISDLLDGTPPEQPLPPDTMCHAGVTYLETLQSMPEDLRTRFYALAMELMARG